MIFKFINPRVFYYIRLLRAARPKSYEYLAIRGRIDKDYKSHKLSDFEMEMIGFWSNAKHRKDVKNEKS